MTEPTIANIALASLRESPTNPRQRYDEAALQELANSIRAEGVVQPLLVRASLATRDPDAHPHTWEIVFGHRRARAAELAGLEAVPCMVRNMSDAECARAQIAENLQREDIHPIEEAAGLRALIDDHGLTVEQLIEQTGKSRSYIYNRLKLASLAEPVRQACLSGKIGAEVATLIARIPERHQPRALAIAMEGRRHEEGQRGYRRIRYELQDKFALELKSAIFDIADATLVDGAGACTGCPKRAGNTPELYADIAAGDNPDDQQDGLWWHDRGKGPATCTDIDCFAQKKAAHLKREAAKVEAQGKIVVTGNKARQALSANGEVKGAYIAAADVRDEIKRMPKDAKPEIITIQDQRTGKLVSAVKKEALKAAGVEVQEKRQAAKASQEKRKREAERAEIQAKEETAWRTHLLGVVRSQAAARERSTIELPAIAPLVWEGTDWQDQEAVATLWGHDTRDQMERRIGQLSAGDLALFMLDCALVQGVHVYAHSLLNQAEALTTIAKHYGLDLTAAREAYDSALHSPAESASPPSTAARATGKAAAKKAGKDGKTKRGDASAARAPAEATTEEEQASPTAPAAAGEEVKDEAAEVGA